MEPIVAALCNELSKSIGLTYFLKTLPARIRRLAYCSRLKCTAADVTFRHRDRPSSGCDTTVRYCDMRNSVQFPLCDTDALLKGRAESAKHIKVTNCVRGFVISLRTLVIDMASRDAVLYHMSYQMYNIGPAMVSKFPLDVGTTAMITVATTLTLDVSCMQVLVT